MLALKASGVDLKMIAVEVDPMNLMCCENNWLDYSSKPQRGGI